MRMGRCYVCGEPFSTGDHFIIVQGEPDLLWRHDGCCPGSERWLRSARAKVSEFTVLFTEAREKQEEKREARAQAQSQEGAHGPDRRRVREQSRKKLKAEAGRRALSGRTEDANRDTP